MVILEDLDKFLTQKKNLKANHIMAGLCLSKYLYCNGQILQGKGDTAMASETKYNTCVQPLDLTFFKSLKIRLQQKIQQWHQVNIGTSLTKYSVVPLL